jgi:transposase-like protein
MVVRIAGERIYLWRAVDHEGEVLDMLVQRRRDTRAALRLMRKLLKKQGFAGIEVAPFQWTVCQLTVYVLVMTASMSVS